MLSNYPGTEDRFTHDILLREWILSQFKKTYRQLGFHLLETPCLEPAELIQKEGAVGDQPTFSFEDKHKDPVCLKPDQTVSLRRLIEQHRLNMPFARHQVGFAFRQDKPERGRWREFLQCDADVIGAPAGIPDAETILWLLEGFKQIGLPETLLFINTRQILALLYEGLGKVPFDELTFVRAMDKVTRSGDPTPAKVYLETPSTRKDIPGWDGLDIAYNQATQAILALLSKIKEFQKLSVQEALDTFATEFPSTAEQVENLRTIVGLAVEAGADISQLRFDPCLARGMDYYTGPVFEAFCPLWPYGSVAGGGRYDQMVKIAGNPVMAVGASFGLDRIEQALKDLGRVPSHCTQRIADALVIVKPDWMPGVMKVAKMLRDAGINTIVYPDPSVSLKLQTRFAAQNDIPVAVFGWPNELENGQISLRQVTSEKAVENPDESRAAKNNTVNLDALIAEVKALI